MKSIFTIFDACTRTLDACFDREGDYSKKEKRASYAKLAGASMLVISAAFYNSNDQLQAQTENTELSGNTAKKTALPAPAQQEQPATYAAFTSQP
ncbi:MAG: hypothetical protein KDJ35_00465 [Alphaproteobacteria bacterium]|nr:hypothetical protein [Alphaproteobacteria bacterium]